MLRKVPMISVSLTCGEREMADDPILKKAMEKRDEALREAERWEGWIKAYVELSDPSPESLDIPMVRRASPEAGGPSDVVELAAALRVPPVPTETSNGKGVWPRD